MSRPWRVLSRVSIWQVCGLLACTPLSELSSYSEGGPIELPVSDAGVTPPPPDATPDIIVGPIQPVADAAPPLDAAPELDAAPDGGSCDGPGEAVGPDGQGCYRFVALAATWNAARLDCESWGGWLVAVGSEAEDDYLATRANGLDLWLGLNDVAVEGQWVWANGEPTGYFNWASNQPDNFQNEDCVEKRAMDEVWNDRNCAAPHVYVCER